MALRDVTSTLVLDEQLIRAKKPSPSEPAAIDDTQTVMDNSLQSAKTTVLSEQATIAEESSSRPTQEVDRPFSHAPPGFYADIIATPVFHTDSRPTTTQSSGYKQSVLGKP